MRLNKLMPKVSVIVPSYNHAKFLRETIDCVLAQTFSDWELVIVDDRSSDDSMAILASYTDPRIRVSQNERNSGTYPTLNRCLDLSTGEYIAVLDSDDLWAPTKLEKQVAALDKNPEASFSYTFGTAVDEEGQPVGRHHLDLPSEPLQQPIASLLPENRILASSVMFRRGLIRFDPEAVTSGDWTALIRLCKLGMAAFIDEPLTFWRHHGVNTSRDHVRCYPEELRIRRTVFDHPDEWFLPGADPEIVRKRLANCAIRIHTSLVYAGEFAEAKRIVRRGLEFDPTNKKLKLRVTAHLLPRFLMVRRLSPPAPLEQFREAYAKMPKEPLDLT
jgi:glycosyltransferase involved in cell wall biosynthesis